MTQNKGVANETDFKHQLSHIIPHLSEFTFNSHFDAVYLPSPGLTLVATKEEAVSLCPTPQMSSSRPPSHNPHAQSKTILSIVPWMIF